MKKIILFIILIFGFAVVFAEPIGKAGMVYDSNGLCYMMSSYVQGGYTDSTPLFDFQILNQPCFYLSYNTFAQGFQFLFDLAIGVTIALAIIMFTYGSALGILNQADVENIAEGKEIMQNALIGLVITLSAWLVINTVNPDLLRLPYFQSLEQLAQRRASSGGSTGVSGSGFVPGNVKN